MKLLGHHSAVHAAVPIPKKHGGHAASDTHRWDKASEDVGHFKLVGITKVTIDPGDFVAEADAHAAIRHITKSWRSAKHWRCGFGEEIVLKYRDVTGDHQKELVMLLEDGRSHTAITYAVSLNNLCIIINEGHYVAFLQKNVGCNVLSKERLPAPDGYVCIVCQASCDAKAGHFAEDLRHLVTEAVVHSVVPQKRTSSASFHRASGALESDGVVYGYEEDENAGMVDHRALWFRGRLHHRESEQLRSEPDTENGDFYIRESSSKGKFTLTVVVDKDEGAVAHFRILTNNMDDKIRMSCYIEGHENVKFRTLTELVEFYDSRGLGEVHGRKVKLLRAMGFSSKGTVMEQKIARMNKLLQRGFNF